MFWSLWRFRCGICVAGARDSASCQKWAKRDGFVEFPKTMAGVGHLQRIWKDACHGAGAAQERWLSETEIFRFAETILRDRCGASYDQASLLRGRRSTLRRWSGKIAKRIGTRPSALHSTFHFWRQSRRIASFLMLSTSKIEGNLAEVFLFLFCQHRKLRKFRRIAAFSSLQTDRQTGR